MPHKFIQKIGIRGKRTLLNIMLNNGLMLRIHKKGETVYCKNYLGVILQQHIENHSCTQY